MNINHEIAVLQSLTPKELRARYLEVFGEPTRSGNKQFMVRRIAWRMQSQVQGTLSERARQRAMELAREVDNGAGDPVAELGRRRTCG